MGRPPRGMEWRSRLPQLVEEAETESGRTDLWFSSTELVSRQLAPVVESHTGWAWDEAGDALEISLRRQAVRSDAARRLRSLTVSIRNVASKLQHEGVLELGHIVRRGLFRNASRVQVIRLPLTLERKLEANKLAEKASEIRARHSPRPEDLKWLAWYDNPRSGFQDHEVVLHQMVR